MASCYSFLLRANDGAHAGAIVVASDIFLAQYNDVTEWDVIVGGQVAETITNTEAETRYVDYVGSCPPVEPDVPLNGLTDEEDDPLTDEDDEFLTDET